MSLHFILGIVIDASFVLFFGAIAIIAGVLCVLGHNRVGGAVGGVGILLLVAVVLPDIRSAKPAAYRAACISNLKMIQDAKAQWADENKKAMNEVPLDSDLFGKERYILKRPQCPANGSYIVGSVGQVASCSEVSKGHRLE